MRSYLGIHFKKTWTCSNLFLLMQWGNESPLITDWIYFIEYILLNIFLSVIDLKSYKISTCVHPHLFFWVWATFFWYFKVQQGVDNHLCSHNADWSQSHLLKSQLHKTARNPGNWSIYLRSHCTWSWPEGQEVISHCPLLKVYCWRREIASWKTATLSFWQINSERIITGISYRF